MSTLTVRQRLAEDGFAVIDPVLSAAEADALLAATTTLEDELGKTGRGGLRNVLQRVPALAELVKHPLVAAVVEDAIGGGAFAVRGILFDKQPGANWKVFWHQDLTVAVRKRADVPGYGPWSSKGGFPHVQPPVEILKQMIAVRVHLDPCGSENGPLRVIPGSHRRGRLGAAEIEALRSREGSVACVVGPGGLLVMRPLLLHASAPAERPRHRRVAHIEFARCELAGGLEWAERWPVQ